MGFPFEHGFAGTLMAMRLAELLEVDSETARETYYTCLLAYIGCTVDRDQEIKIFGGDMTANVIPVIFGSFRERAAGLLAALPPPDSTGLDRGREIAKRLPKALRANADHQRALCEVAQVLGQRLGVPTAVHDLFHHLTERWDGRGVLRRSRGEDIPLPLRIAILSRDAANQRLIGGEDHAVAVIANRMGKAFDPVVAEMFVTESAQIFAAADADDTVWDRILDLEPTPFATLDEGEIDKALAAIGDFADLISPSLSGHSAGLAHLVGKAARSAGFSNNDVTLMKRAALVHDVGRVAIDARIWEKPTSLTPDEVEQVRRHPYHTERILIRSRFLGTLAPVASNHHEHLDGSGYHRGVTAPTLTRSARLLAVADIYHAMTEPRPHRGPLPSDTAAALLQEQVREGHLDPQMVEVVLEAAGQDPLPPDYPNGLTEREVEVLRLLARGLRTKQIASTLDMSVKTVNTQSQNAYKKINVSTRAAATLFVMETGLIR
jgi:HD-GYP domain-containing protein (c-di-GMP phosphodiesterase class II)